MSVFGLSDQIKCVQREIRLREFVYPKWVSMKKVSQAKADLEIALMKSVLETLQKLERVQQAAKAAGEVPT
jgi:hypothetical protein